MYYKDFEFLFYKAPNFFIEDFFLQDAYRYKSLVKNAFMKEIYNNYYFTEVLDGMYEISCATKPEEYLDRLYFFNKGNLGMASSHLYNMTISEAWHDKELRAMIAYVTLMNTDELPSEKKSICSKINHRSRYII